MAYGQSSQRRTVVFHDTSYPQSCSDATLVRLIPGEYEIAGAAELTRMVQDDCRTLISFHGSYFPKAAWTAIEGFLIRGGNLAIFGGMPFTRPVRSDGTIEPEQQAYTDRLCLGPFFKLDLPDAPLKLESSQETAFLTKETIELSAEQRGTFWSFYPKFTQVSDHPEDLGSAGPLDTVLTPLLYLNSETPGAGQHVATSALLLDQHHGQFKGGRWLLSPWQPASEEVWLAQAATLQQCIALAIEGCTQFTARPLFACYQPGEAPTLSITARTQHDLYAQLRIQTPHGSELSTHELYFINSTSSSIQQEQRIQLPTQTEPGFYHVTVHYKHALLLTQETGFWVWDSALVERTRNQRLTAGRDYFYQQGEPFLIFGTTYMDSSVQRKYLALPNPARWERDFAEMRQAGINLIRTGIWTAWRDVMPTVGVMDEATLRAFDAFVLTACKHNIQVIFTFFAFYPPLFEGKNPWLDPRSIEGQQDFVTIFARRYAGVPLVWWDLINEPSFGDPKKIFSKRPIPHYDSFELKAFQNWLAERYTLSELQVRWRQTPSDFATWDDITLPNEADYSTHLQDTSTRQMLKVMDYTAFSQDMFRNWAAQMYAAMRTAGSETLIGVGQDEAGARPSPQFYAPVVDYTTTHPWWNNDDLLWDMLLDKTLETPNLLQEIGVMLVRDVDMRPWRSEQENANLLERKLITGIIARGAGLIQWLWHINAGMTSENENSIGLVRPDGSAKPELAVMLGIGKLAQELEKRMVEPVTPPDIWVVIPYMQWFLRPELSIEATRRAIRVLGYDLGITPQMIGEHQLTTLAEARHHPRTIIVPGTQTFPTSAWQALHTFAEQGTTVLISGAFSHDQHKQTAQITMPAHTEETPQETAPVSRYERLEVLPGESYQLTYGQDKIGYVRKAHQTVQIIPVGAGKIIWSGLPVELAENPQAVRRVYQLSLEHSANMLQDESPLLVIRRPVKNGSLVLLVSESSAECTVTLKEGTAIKVLPNRAGAVIIEHDGSTKLFGGIR